MAEDAPREPIFAATQFILCGEILYDGGSIAGFGRFRSVVYARGYPRTFGPPDDELYALTSFGGLADGLETFFIEIVDEETGGYVYSTPRFDVEVRAGRLSTVAVRLAPEFQEPGFYRVDLYWSPSPASGDDIRVKSTLFRAEHF